MNRTTIKLILLFISLSIFGGHSFAQEGGEEAKSQFEPFYGYVLPNGLDGADEIFTMWGGRYSAPFSEDNNRTFYEFGGVYADDEGVTWYGAFLSARMDIPVETITAVAYLGLDFTSYEGVGGEDEQFGGHAGGGLMSRIGRASHVRFDMKLNSRPGTSLFFNLGITFELDDSEGAGDNN